MCLRGLSLCMSLLFHVASNSGFRVFLCFFMRKIYFVRHGQSLANAGGVTMEHHAIPLTDIGHRQAAALSVLLPDSPSEIHVSPFVRARDTAIPYCQRVALQPFIGDGLREFETIDPTLLIGMTGAQRRPIADAYWTEGDAFKRMGERAETFVEFSARVAAFKALTLPTISDNAVVFGHGMWIAMLFWQLMAFPYDDGFAMKAFRRFQMGFPMPNGAVYCFTETAPGHWGVKANERVLRLMVDLASN